MVVVSVCAPENCVVITSVSRANVMKVAVLSLVFMMFDMAVSV